MLQLPIDLIKYVGNFLYPSERLLYVHSMKFPRQLIEEVATQVVQSSAMLRSNHLIITLMENRWPIEDDIILGMMIVTQIESLSGSYNQKRRLTAEILRFTKQRLCHGWEIRQVSNYKEYIDITFCTQDRSRSVVVGYPTEYPFKPPVFHCKGSGRIKYFKVIDLGIVDDYSPGMAMVSLEGTHGNQWWSPNWFIDALNATWQKTH